MAVSKRLRFEILRRDEHTCRYCGGKAPDVHLTVDHVVPVALGGDDNPDNLVAACRECNSGKTSLPADASIVADVSVRSFIWRTALDMAWEEWRAKRRGLAAMQEHFREAWDDWSRTEPDGEVIRVPRAGDWADAVETWIALGFTVDELAAFIPKAMRRANRDDFKGGLDAIWPYYCGIVWKTAKELQANITDYIEAANDEAVREQRAQARAHAIQAKLEEEEWYEQESVWWRDETDDYRPLGGYAWLEAA